MVSSNFYANMHLSNIKKYNFLPGKTSSLEDTDNKEVDQDKSIEVQNLDNNRCISKFLDQEKSELNVSDIIKDFKATMTQIGVPKEIGTDIMKVIKSVHIEASKENPSISQIQNGLCTASEKLDNYISQTLGNSSTVVKQWMDTLLIQKINYKAYDPLSNSQESRLNEKTNATNPFTSSIKGTSFLNIESNKTDEDKNNINDLSKSVISEGKSINISQDTESININQSEKLLSEDDTINKTNISSFNNLVSLELTSEKMYNNAKQDMLSGKVDSAINKYKETILEATDLMDNKTLLKSYVDLAEIYDKKNDLKTALNQYNEALKIATSTNDKEYIAKIHYNVATIYDDLNMITQAMKHYHESLSIDGETDNLEGQALTLNNVGSLYSYQNDNKTALEHFRMAYSIASQVNDNEGKSNILSNIASVYTNMNDYTNAIDYYRRSLKIDQQNQNLPGATKTLVNLAKVYEYVDNPDKANKCLNKAFDNARELNDPGLLGYLYNKLFV